jgi:steroid 5-alpha reductase family enzyme
LRLALHIGRRNWGKPEDFRYATWRNAHGAHWWWWSFFQVFTLQGFLMWIVALPIIAAQTSGFPAILTPLDMLGVSLWAFGLIFEAISDWQLERFKHDTTNKGTILTTGLWKYSRHPNYFGETMLWWGMYIVALATGAWWTIVSPILMTWLLVRVSGVAMLERTMKHKPGYEEYIQKTSPFFPWFPGRR